MSRATGSATIAAPSPWRGTAEPHSADAQFYINLADNVALDPKPTRWGYAVFGEVVEGMDVVDDIGHRATVTKDQIQDIPPNRS